MSLFFDIASDNAASDNAASDNAASDNAASDNAASDKVALGRGGASEPFGRPCPTCRLSVSLPPSDLEGDSEQ